MTTVERGHLYLLFRGYQDMLRHLGQDSEQLEDLVLLIEGLGYWVPETLVKFQNWSAIYGNCERQ